MVLEIAQSFHAHTTAQFRSAQRLSSGETKLVYDEEVRASAGKTGELEVPRVLELGISPFVGEAAVRINAQLRYRVASGTLRIGYKLERPEQVVRDAVETMAAKLRSEFAHVYSGTPAA